MQCSHLPTPAPSPLHACRLVSLTGVVSPEEQQQELFGPPQPEPDQLTAAGSTTVRPSGPPHSPPPVEQRWAAPSPPASPAPALPAAAEAEAEAEAAADKDKEL